MKIGVFTALYSALPLRRVLDKVAALGVETVELGTGNYPGKAHCDPDELLASPAKLRGFRRAIESRGLEISALSQHGNPLHPREPLALKSHRVWRATVELAAALEVPTVIAFSGCPGDGAGASYPNWVTCAWPDDYAEVLEWQWSERVIPYWSREVEFARALGVRVAVEPHAGFVVYDTETLLRLRAAAGPELGANYDPSHLFWQGIDPVLAVDDLAAADAIFHVHAKDTFLDPELVRRKGVVETTPFDRHDERAWSFRTVGDGHPERTWRDIVRALRRAGYDGALSIEHEDPLLRADEGLARGVAFLRAVVATEARGARARSSAPSARGSSAPSRR
jgi:sugar phosphate isomerase/epimerase